MLKRISTMIIMTALLCTMVHAQQRFVVVDMETRMPLRDVLVRLPSGKVTSTVWDGSFTLGVAAPCDSVACDTLGAAAIDGFVTKDTMDVGAMGGFVTKDTVKITVSLSKPGYLGRKMELTHRTDTIELLPSYNKLSEVVVWGTDRQQTISFSLAAPTKDEIAEIAGPPTGIGIGDVMLGIEKLINHKKRKRAKKIKESLEKY